MNAKFYIILLFLVLPQIGHSQNQSKTVSENTSVLPVVSSVDRNEGEGDAGRDENLKFIEAGYLAEKQLQDTSLRSDSDLKTREFIIQRSPDIQIRYTPSSSNKKD